MMTLILLLQRETTTMSRTAVLPAMFHAMSPQAKEYVLACINLPSDVSVDVLVSQIGFTPPHTHTHTLEIL